MSQSAGRLIASVMIEELKIWLYRNNGKLDYLQVLNYFVFALIYLKFWLFPTEKVSFLKDSINLFMAEFLMG